MDGSTGLPISRSAAAWMGLGRDELTELQHEVDTALAVVLTLVERGVCEARVHHVALAPVRDRLREVSQLVSAAQALRDQD